MAKKLCKHCGKEKDREDFYKLSCHTYKEHWDCRDSYCKKCRGLYSSERTRETKIKAVEFLGGECMRCHLKTDHVEVYDFHHTDPSKKEFSISSSKKNFDSIKNELLKCELYCANCHRIIHYGVDAYNE